MDLTFKSFWEAIVDPGTLGLRKFNYGSKPFLSSSIDLKIDKKGQVVLREPEDKSYFSVQPRGKTLALQKLSPQSIDFRKIVNALRPRYPDIYDWEVEVYKQAGHMQTGREPNKYNRSVGYWMQQGTVNLRDKLPEYVYHGTSTNLWYESIKKNGLLPRRLSGSSGSYGAQNVESLGRNDAVYLSTHPDAATRSASRQAARKYGGQPLILKISTSGLSPQLLVPDEDSSAKDAHSSVQIMSTFGYKGIVPPHNIEPMLLGTENQTKSRLFASWEKFKDVPVSEHPLTTQLKDGRLPYRGEPEYYALLDAGIIADEDYDSNGWKQTRTVLKKPVKDEEIKRILKSANWTNNVKSILKDLDNGYRGSLYSLKNVDVDKIKKNKLFDMLVDSGLVSIRSYNNRRYLDVNSWNPTERAIKLAKMLGNKDFRDVQRDIINMTNIDN